MPLPESVEKQINILDYSLSSLWRRAGKNISILMVFTAVIFLIASFQLVTSALTNTAAIVLTAAPEITVQRLSAGRQIPIPISDVEKISTIFGIRRIVPRIWGYYFDESNGANYTIMAMNFRQMPRGNELARIISGTTFPGQEKNGYAVLGQQVKDIMQLTGRRSISLFRPDLSLKAFSISGIFASETDILTGDIIAMNMHDGRDLFQISPQKATDICVYVTNPREIGTIARKIANLLPGTRVLTRPQIEKTYKVVFGWRSGFASVCLLTALAAFIILAWDKASGLAPEEKKEIAILKILGWETTDILMIRFWEGLLVAIFAFILGCTFAYIHVFFFDAVLFRPVLVGWSVIFPPLRLVPTFALSDFLLIFSFTVLPYLTATVIPAWRCATVPTDTALR